MKLSDLSWKTYVFMAGRYTLWQAASMVGWLYLWEICPCCCLCRVWASLGRAVTHSPICMRVFNKCVVSAEMPPSGAGALGESLSPSLTSVANWERFPLVSWGRGGGFMNWRNAFLMQNGHIPHPPPPLNKSTICVANSQGFYEYSSYFLQLLETFLKYELK